MKRDVKENKFADVIHVQKTVEIKIVLSNGIKDVARVLVPVKNTAR